MAVYTELSTDEIATALRQFGLPPPRRCRSIPEGSINTNFQVELEDGTPVFLRHSTVRSAADLEFEAEVLDALIAAGAEGPRLLRPRSGGASLPLKGGQLSLFGWLEGEELTRDRFRVAHAEALGAALATMHLSTSRVRGARENPYGPATVAGWIEGLRDPVHGVAELAAELSSALELAVADDLSALPRGVIHADLFMDNVKWPAPDRPVFFDFEMACRDALALDLAITMNAWAFDSGRYLVDHCRAFLAAYDRVRPLLPAERRLLWNEALFGAVRYSCSRIRDFHLSKLGSDKLFKKDFRTYLARTRVLVELGRAGFAEAMGI